MKNILPNLIIVSFLTIVLSCATDDAIPVAENTTTPNPTEDPTEDPQQQYDYMLYTRSGSSSNGFITGFDNFPEGDLDIPNLPTTLAYPSISGGVSYNRYTVNQQKLFGGAGYQRVILDENKVPNEGEIIETLGGGSSVVILNDTKGYYTDFNTLNIQIFNPQTFQRIGEIDMSEAYSIPENDANYYNSLYVVGNTLYACLYTGRSFPPFIYESNVGSIVAIIDTTTDTYQSNIFREETKYPGQPFLRFKNSTVDEQGNLYLPTQGGFGLEEDPEIPVFAKLTRISNETSNFDDFEFIPQLSISSSTAETVINAGFLYVGNGIAYTNVLMEDPETSSDLVNKALMRWVRVDLISQTAQLIEGIPRNAGLTTGMAYNFNNKVQLPVYDPETGESAIYETDPSSTLGTRVFNVTAGGIIYGFYQVEE